MASATRPLVFNLTSERRCYTFLMKEKKYIRRWKGFTEKEVRERMTMLGNLRFKTKEEKQKFSRAGVEARRKNKMVKPI